MIAGGPRVSRILRLAAKLLVWVAREPIFGERRALTDDALVQLGPLRAALDAYRRSGDTVYLDAAFAAARALIAVLPFVGGRPRPELEELRWVTQTVPEFSELLSSAADEAARLDRAGAGGRADAVRLHVCG